MIFDHLRTAFRFPLLAFVAVAVLVVAAPAAAQQARSVRRSPTLAEAVRLRLVETPIVSGRLTVTTTRRAPIQTSGNERLTIRLTGRETLAKYEESSPDEEICLEIVGSNRARLARTPKGNAAQGAVEFVQPPHGMVSLHVGAEDKQQVYTAPSLWHLLIIEREVCRQHLVPLLAKVNDTWDLLAMRDQVEEELIDRLARQTLPNRDHWTALVGELGHERFTRREAADRELRASGPLVASHLQSLDTQQLDAEQRFRIRRILHSFSSDQGTDTPGQIALWLATDPRIWLALLQRDEEPTRRLAAEQLKLLLDPPVVFDPAADPAVRREQIEQLRARMPRS